MAGTDGDERSRGSVLATVVALAIVVLLAVVLVDRPDGPPGEPGATPADAAGVSPLRGEPGAGAAVLAVKIDNAAAARPWVGVEDADVVYVEPVEGGSTRLLAVFASRLPESVGPVRSVRGSDLGVLAAYGGPALAFSGSAPELDGPLAGSTVVAVDQDDAPEAFRRDPSRPAPHDLLADPAALLAAAPDVAGPRDVGFRFGPVPAGGEPREVTTAVVGGTRVELTWADGRWALDFGDGAAGSAATVVVQRVAVRDSGVRDGAGNPSPTAETVGAGSVEVLRDGRALPGTWSRPEPGAPTRFLDPAGAPLRFAPGPVWVLLSAS